MSTKKRPSTTTTTTTTSAQKISAASNHVLHTHDLLLTILSFLPARRSNLYALIRAVCQDWHLVAKHQNIWLPIMKREAPAQVHANYLILKEQQQEMQEAGDTSIGSTSIYSFFASWSVSYKIRHGVDYYIERKTNAKRAKWLRRFKLRLKGSHLVFSFVFLGKKEENDDRKWNPLTEQVIVPLDDEEKLYRFFEKGTKIGPDELDEGLFDMSDGGPRGELSRRLCMGVEMYIIDAQRGGKITHLVREPEFHRVRNKSRVGQEAWRFVYGMSRLWCRHLFALAQEASIADRFVGVEVLLAWQPALNKGATPQSSVGFRDPGLHVMPRITKYKEQLNPTVVYEALYLIMEG